jgi:DNA-binding response OmpR family regulator
MIKDDPACAGITVVMLTAKAKEWDRSWGEEAGADDYVTKPFSPGELRERVAELMRRLET